MSGMRVLPMALPLLLLRLEAAAPELALEGPPGTEGYYWFKRAGTYVGNGAVPFKFPTDLSKPPAWTWDNPDDELFRHGPVIDDKKNIYAATAFGWIRKFSPDGQVLWSLRTSMAEGNVVTSPFLYKGRLYITSMGMGLPKGQAHIVHCIDMETGERVWSKLGPSGTVNMDSSTVHAAEGVLLGATMSHPSVGGNNKIWAVNTTDGNHLWDFVIEPSVVWNFMPSTPGDGTFLFASNCASAERHRLSDGSRIWKNTVGDIGTCGTGGGTLGPDGVFYAVGNQFGLEPPPGVPLCVQGYCPEGPGIMVAYDMEDGKIRWVRRLGLGLGGFQYPTVGKIDGVMRIVAGIGTNPSIPEFTMGPKFLPEYVRFQIARLQVRFAWLRRLLEVPAKRNAVAVHNAEKGDLVWLWEEEPWSYFGAAGDEMTFIERALKTLTDPRVECICGPDNWGIPVIAADGTVIMGSGSSGNLYAIRDKNGDKVIDPSEVSTFKTGNAFLNGPAVAPGMMVGAPCWGKMYVFKD